MGIQEFIKGQVSPMETGKKTDGEDKEMDMSLELATKATSSIGLERVESLADKAEEARKNLETEVNTPKTQEERQDEIKKILENLK